MPGLGAAMGGLGNRILAEIDDATGTTTREYLWLGDRVVAVAPAGPSSATLYYVTTDHLTRPVQMTGPSKAVVWRAKYGPFGEVLETTGPASLTTRYPGQWFQLENGLAWNWHRHYDASLGRYVQPDPLGLVDGPSVYGYVRQNPVMGVDPEGTNVGVWVGGEMGTIVWPGAGTVVGGVVGGICVFWFGDEILDNFVNSEESDAPGVPSEKDGFSPPKNWDGQKVKSPNGNQKGWPDRKGDVWVPTGPGPLAHGGPHWDVQSPKGRYRNVYPGGRTR